MVKATKESGKEMERKVEAALEDLEILDLAFGSKCDERKKLVEDAMRLIKEQVSLTDSEECERILKCFIVFQCRK